MHMYMWTQPQFSSNYLKHFYWQDQVVSMLHPGLGTGVQRRKTEIRKIKP